VHDHAYYHGYKQQPAAAYSAVSSKQQASLRRALKALGGECIILRKRTKQS
jgi:hypothetical protein